MNTGVVDAVSNGLDRLTEELAKRNARRGWAPLENARKAAAENDRAWEDKLVAAERPYWAADGYDIAYWHRLLDGQVSPETFDTLMHSMGLLK